MSTRSRDAQHLARLLTEHTGIPVTVTYHGNAKDYLGGWHVGWTDGPTVASMLRWVVMMADLRDITVPIRAYDRGNTDLAEACALLSWLTGHPEEAQHITSSVMLDVHEQAEHPETGDEITSSRGQALLSLSPAGSLTPPVLDQLRKRAVSDGFPAVLEWLDRIAAGTACPGVVDLAEARRKRGAAQ